MENQRKVAMHPCAPIFLATHGKCQVAILNRQLDTWVSMGAWVQIGESFGDARNVVPSDSPAIRGVSLASFRSPGDRVRR